MCVMMKYRGQFIECNNEELRTSKLSPVPNGKSEMHDSYKTLPL